MEVHNLRTLHILGIVNLPFWESPDIFRQAFDTAHLIDFRGLHQWWYPQIDVLHMKNLVRLYTPISGTPRKCISYHVISSIFQIQCPKNDGLPGIFCLRDENLWGSDFATPPSKDIYIYTYVCMIIYIYIHIYVHASI